MMLISLNFPSKCLVLSRQPRFPLKNVCIYKNNKCSVRYLSILSTKSNDRCHHVEDFKHILDLRRNASLNSVAMSLVRSHSSRAIYSRKHPAFEFDVDESIPKNTLVFSEDNDKYYKLLSITGIVQLIFWLNLSHFVLTQMHDEVVADDENEVWWKKSWMWKNKNRNGISVLLTTIGCFTFYFCMVYPARSIKQLWLLRGGEYIQLYTYALFSKGKILKVPLKQVSGVTSRGGASSSVALKVKNKSYYFLLHTKKGVFHQPRLFDHVVALKRFTKSKK